MYVSLLSRNLSKCHRTLSCSHSSHSTLFYHLHLKPSHWECLQWRISATGVQSTQKNLGVATPTLGHMNAFMSRVASRYHRYLRRYILSMETFSLDLVRTEYLEATLGLVKRLEISKELIRECVTVPGCCCCMPLLHNHLIDSCSYVRKNTLLATKWGCICAPLNPPLVCSAFAKCYYYLPNNGHRNSQQSNPC